MSRTILTNKDDKTSKISASKSNFEETKESSEESVRQDTSDRKMAAKPSKTKTTKTKPLPKDNTTLYYDQVEVLKSVLEPYPAKPAKVTKKKYMTYYKKKAHYFQKKLEGATSEIGVCSDISYSSSEE